MNYDEKCAFLRGYRDSTRKIAMIEDEINTIRMAKMFPSTVPDDGMPHAHNISDLSNYAVQIDELLTEARKELEEAHSRRKEIIRAIDSIDCDEAETYKLILRYRYINIEHGRLMSWEKIAVKTDYSYDWVRHLHRRGVDALEI